MNELLAKLAEQAAEHAVLNPSESVLRSESEDRKVEIPAEFIDKFALLIVRECARVYWNIDQSETHTEYVNDLKKHFGVE